MKRFTSLLMALGAIFFLSACTQQSEITALQRRIASQDQELQSINRQVSGVQPAQADTWAQVQALRQEMEAVRGEIDNFNNATGAVGGLPELAAKVERHNVALQSIGTQFGMNLNLHKPGTSPIPIPPVAVVKPTPVPTPVSVAKPKPAKPSAETSITLYDAGITSFNARKYQQAFNAFRDFTDTYSTHRLIANAWFWRGESNYQMGKYAAAALDYETVISKYPTSAKLPSSYLKQGMSFFKAGKADAARFRLDELLKKFPQSPEATRAKNVLAENK